MRIDNGAAFWQPETGQPSVVGVTKAGQSEVFIAGNRPFSRYYSAFYYTQYKEAASGGDLSNSLDTNVATDNGVVVLWNLGAIDATTATRYRLSFSSVNTPPVAGDGSVTGFESCDDANVQSGDGCSDIMQIEDGWTCAGAPSSCAPAAVCGNGTIESGEACDDHNTTAGDGCATACTVESGWVCGAGGCATTCGDGLRVGAEACDDHNTTAGDGCSPTCTAESGWTCGAGDCATTCGDGTRSTSGQGSLTCRVLSGSTQSVLCT